MGVDGDDAGPARDRGLSEFRRRPARPSPRHRVQHQGRRDDVRRAGRGLDRANRSGRDLHRAVCGRRLRDLVGAAGTRHSRDGRLRRNVAVHQPLAQGGLRPDREAGRRHRHGLERCSAHTCCRPRSSAARGISAFAYVHTAVASTPLRARRVGRDEGPLSRDTRGPARTPDWCRAAERLFGAARDARQPAAEVGLAARNNCAPSRRRAYWVR